MESSSTQDVEQPSKKLEDVLKGVVAYVDFRDGRTCERAYFSEILESMGATIAKGLNKHVTHVVFYNGPKKTYEKAKARGLHILSGLWVLRCQKELTRLPEKDFPANVSSDYDNPRAKIKMKKMLRTMTIEELRKRDSANQKRLKTRRERREILERLKRSPPTPFVPEDLSKYKWLRTAFDSTEMLKCFKRLEELLPSDEEYDIDDHYTLPLPLRILNNDPSPTSPVLSFLTENQRKAAKRILEKHGKVFPELKPIPKLDFSVLDRKPISSNAEKTPVKQESESASKAVEKDTEKESESERKWKLDEVKQDLTPMLNETTPVTTRYRKRLRSKSKSPAVTPQANTSLDEFKPMKTKPKKRLKLDVNDLLNDTQNLSLVSPSSKTCLSPVSTKRIILSSYDMSDKETLVPILRYLKQNRLELSVERSSTHVICKKTRRTFSVMMGIVHGCWILEGTWVMDSMEANKWLNEEKYEIKDFPGAKIARQKRIKMGTKYECDLFKSCGSVYITKDIKLPRSNLTLLFTSAGAKVVNSISNASLVIGKYNGKVNNKCQCVNEQWALDSITSYKLLPVKDYPVCS